MPKHIKLNNKNILLISPEPWDHIFVSKHHYAICLGRAGNSVYFLNPPTKSFRVKESGYQNVYIVDYKGFPKGLRFYPRRLQKLLIKQVYRKLQKLCSEIFDIVWSFDNSIFYNFSALPENTIKISHIVDLNQDFQLEKAATMADICFCTTDLIREKLIQYNKKVHKINHGLNYHLPNRISQLPGFNALKAIYVGNLAMPYIDWEIIYSAVCANRQVDFVFIGPGKNSFHEKSRNQKEALLDAKNAYFIDRIEADEIINYLSSANILIIAYMDKHHKDQANPHKMMEYLSSGKPIVATYTEEYADMKDMVIMSKSNGEWPTLFTKVVKNLSFYRTPQWSAKRIAFAMDNTYEKQIERIEYLIGEHMYMKVSSL